MEFIKRSWRYIRTQLEQLSTNAKLLIGALLIILVMSLLLILTYAGSPDFVPISQFAADRHDEAAAVLQRAGIRIKTKDGRLLVPTDRQFDALVVLGERDLMAPDTSAAFDELIKNTSFWDSNFQLRQKMGIALQKMLGQVIGKMKGVRSADVVISKPDHVGFGTSFIRPRASVNVVMRSRSPMGQPLVESIAGMVSGAVAEMLPQDVFVIDANNGQQHKVDDLDEINPEDALALVKSKEKYWHQKILDQLTFIPGVIVAVNVMTDSIMLKNVMEFTYKDSEPLKLIEEILEKEENLKMSGEPGVRANASETIRPASPGGTTSLREVNRQEFGELPLTKEAKIKHRGQETIQINASVAVPLSHFVTVFKGQQAAGANDQGDQDNAQPDDAFITEQLAKIEEKILPIIETPKSKGVLKVSMYDDGPIQLALSAQMASATGIGALLRSPWMKPVGLGVLSLMALAVMLSMVRKATQAPAIPSAEELAGVPPTLPSDEDLIGEAEESETSMAGVEIAEQDIRSRKLADQISALVKANPEEAANLIKKWVNTEE